MYGSKGRMGLIPLSLKREPVWESKNLVYEIPCAVTGGGKLAGPERDLRVYVKIRA